MQSLRLATLLLPAALILTTPALAQTTTCPGRMLLDCDISKTRVLQVCLANDSFHYRYGPRGKADLALSVALAEGTVAPWPGVGQDIWTTLSFLNADHRYEVWTSSPRGGDAPQSAGVTVYKGAATVAELRCQPGTTRSPDVVFEDVMTEAGYCYAANRRRWTRC